MARASGYDFFKDFATDEFEAKPTPILTIIPIDPSGLSGVVCRH